MHLLETLRLLMKPDQVVLTATSIYVRIIMNEAIRKQHAG